MVKLHFHENWMCYYVYLYGLLIFYFENCMYNSQIFDAKFDTIKNCLLVNRHCFNINFLKHWNTLCQINVAKMINVEQHFGIKGYFIKGMINTLCNMFPFKFFKNYLVHGNYMIMNALYKKWTFWPWTGYCIASFC
jgi:hypothetical protein